MHLIHWKWWMEANRLVCRFGHCFVGFGPTGVLFIAGRSRRRLFGWWERCWFLGPRPSLEERADELKMVLLSVRVQHGKL